MTAELVKKWLISGLISGNLAISTGSCIRKSIILMFLSSSRDKFTLFSTKLSDRCFCWFPAAMLVPIWMSTNMVSHTNLYKFGWHTSANSAQIKYSRDLIIGKVVYIAIIYHILDSWIYLSNGYDFYFWSHDWWKPRIDYFIQGRYINCSVIYLTQSYYGFPKSIRINCSHFCSYDFLRTRERNFKIAQYLGMGKDKYIKATLNYNPSNIFARARLV